MPEEATVAHDAPECLQCGTCCFSTLQNYIRVTGDDHVRLGDLADDYVVFDGNRAYMAMHDGHCAALYIDTQTASFVCSIYAFRPETCRTLERHSDACAAERELKSDRPLIALRRQK